LVCNNSGIRYQNESTSGTHTYVTTAPGLRSGLVSVMLLSLGGCYIFNHAVNMWIRTNFVKGSQGKVKQGLENGTGIADN
jgi:hypothetical protein